MLGYLFRERSCSVSRSVNYVSKRFFPKKITIARLKELQRKEDDGLVKKRPYHKHGLSIEHAVRFAILLSRKKFDETVQLHLNMNLDSRKGDQQIRGNIYLPYGTGQTVRVCVFCPESKVQEALDSGADLIADDSTLADIKNSVFNFDRVIATPDQMRKLKTVARQLGPAGLMPNPKMGTLTTNIKSAILDSKAGQVPVRLTKEGCVQGRVGKLSMGEDRIVENIKAFITQIRNEFRPQGAKEDYFLGSVVSTSMGRGYRLIVDTNEPWATSLIAAEPQKDAATKSLVDQQKTYFVDGVKSI